MDFELRNMVKVGILGEERQHIPDTGGGYPGVHHARPAPALAGLRNDRSKHPRYLGIDRKRLELALDAAGGTKTPGPSCAIPRQKNPQVKLGESRYGYCRFIGEFCQLTPVFETDEYRRVEKPFQSSSTRWGRACFKSLLKPSSREASRRIASIFALDTNADFDSTGTRAATLLPETVITNRRPCST